MCGIFGIISKDKNVSPLIYDASFSMQNRGDNATGITTLEERFHSIRSKGTIQEIMIGRLNLREDEITNKDIEKMLPGYIGIGHNRYGTSGSNTARDAQPLDIQQPGIAICHNGQVNNIISLKRELSKRYTFQTENDVEVILLKLSKELHDLKYWDINDNNEYVYKKLFPSIKKVMEDVKGSYSVIAIIANKGIVAFRDPYGIRPLSWAKRIKNGKYSDVLFSSETCAFNMLGDCSEVEDINNGEAIFVDNNFNIYRDVLYQKELRFCPFEFAYFAQPDSDFMGKKVDLVRKKLGLMLAEVFSDIVLKLDVILAVPNTGITAAMGMSEGSKIPYEAGIQRRSGSKLRSFQQKNEESRNNIVRRKYTFIKEHIKGKRIGIVDDSIVRGTTSKKLVRILFDLGAKEVHLFSTFPMFRYPCVFGIDTPSEEELIACRLKGDLEKMRKEIGGYFNDKFGLYYPSINDFVKALDIDKNKLCFACVHGNYPTDISEFKEYQILREKERKII